MAVTSLWVSQEITSDYIRMTRERHLIYWAMVAQTTKPLIMYVRPVRWWGRLSARCGAGTSRTTIIMSTSGSPRPWLHSVGKMHDGDILWEMKHALTVCCTTRMKRLQTLPVFNCIEVCTLLARFTLNPLCTFWKHPHSLCASSIVINLHEKG